MSTYREIVGRMNYGMFLVTVFLLPFPQIFLRYACVIWIVLWLLEGRWLNRPKPIRENKMAIPFLLFGLWYAWKALSGLWAADHAAWAWQMERYLSFGLMIPVGIWGLNRHYDWRVAGKVLVYSCVAAVIVHTAVLTALFYYSGIREYFNWVGQFDYYSWSDWYMFVSENISVLKHRLFFCSVELFGIIIACQVYSHKKWLLACLILIMLVSIPLSGSRQAILTLAGILIVALITALPKRLRLRYGVGVVLIGVVLGFGLLQLHPRMQGFEIKSLHEMLAFSPYHDTRLNVWGTLLQKPSDYVWGGLGAGQSVPYLTEQYTLLGIPEYSVVSGHCHNQYLEETIEIGIFGMLLFVLAWLSVPLCATNKGRRTALYFTTLFMLNMFTDCMFGRFCGIALWSVGLLFILLQSDPQRQ